MLCECSENPSTGYASTYVLCGRLMPMSSETHHKKTPTHLSLFLISLSQSSTEQRSLVVLLLLLAGGFELARKETAPYLPDWARFWKQLLQYTYK